MNREWAIERVGMEIFLRDQQRLLRAEFPVYQWDSILPVWWRAEQAFGSMLREIHKVIFGGGSGGHHEDSPSILLRRMRAGLVSEEQISALKASMNYVFWKWKAWFLNHLDILESGDVQVLEETAFKNWTWLQSFNLLQFIAELRAESIEARIKMHLQVE
ncbi:hypothetical protein BJ508DRAFT_336101 [Ascobolus immersus RN42]|uniref:Uncharacterized protein n=1 Tax=Ascobolus immersus RN42 TaxID=1160509 RepID=A0A3N4H9R8_ASCIM|nr:hypothetical protein BJ508DRAFT_336101 [Ascobolus immersus RN42]